MTSEHQVFCSYAYTHTQKITKPNIGNENRQKKFEEWKLSAEVSVISFSLYSTHFACFVLRDCRFC